jgi:hypothetical protein
VEILKKIITLSILLIVCPLPQLDEAGLQREIDRLQERREAVARSFETLKDLWPGEVINGREDRDDKDNPSGGLPSLRLRD